MGVGEEGSKSRALAKYHLQLEGFGIPFLIMDRWRRKILGANKECARAHAGSKVGACLKFAKTILTQSDRKTCCLTCIDSILQPIMLRCDHS